MISCTHPAYDALVAKANKECTILDKSILPGCFLELAELGNSIAPKSIEWTWSNKDTVIVAVDGERLEGYFHTVKQMKAKYPHSKYILNAWNWIA